MESDKKLVLIIGAGLIAWYLYDKSNKGEYFYTPTKPLGKTIEPESSPSEEEKLIKIEQEKYEFLKNIEKSEQEIRKKEQFKILNDMKVIREDEL